MCKGERPMGATKGKQTNTMASCQPPLPPNGCWRGTGAKRTSTQLGSPESVYKPF